MSEPTAHDRVRASYNAVASSYAAHFRDELSDKPLDRALLGALLEQAGPAPRVLDVGCGPGHVTGWLSDAGARAVGIDLSDEMVSLASVEYPDCEFRWGDVLALPAADQEFDAAIAFYSLIHLQEAELTDALVEIHRTLKVDGTLLASFHVGRDVVHRDEWFEATVDLDFHFFEMSDVVTALAAAGFAVTAELRRRPYNGEADTSRRYVVARRSHSVID